MFSNETMENRSFVHQDRIVLYAGHIFIVFYCLIFLLGFLGNFAVIYVGIRKKNYRNVTNCYVINLAFADLCFISLSIPYTTYLGLVDILPLGEKFCKIYMLLTYVFLLATCNTLAAMSVDRYFYIVLPRSKLLWRTSRNAMIISIFIWISSFLLIIPYYIFRANRKTCDLNDDRNFLICFMIFSFYYAIPLLIIIICYTKLAMHVAQSHRLLAKQTITKNIAYGLETKRRRVTKMVFIVTLAFAICWLPIHILELLKCADVPILHKMNRIYPKGLYTLRAITHALAYLNSCLNPYLYALLNRNFCFELIDLIPNWFSCWNINPFRLTSLNQSSQGRQCSSGYTTYEMAFQKRHAHDNDASFQIERSQIMQVDVSCQVNLLKE